MMMMLMNASIIIINADCDRDEDGSSEMPVELHLPQYESILEHNRNALGTKASKRPTSCDKTNELMMKNISSPSIFPQNPGLVPKILAANHHLNVQRHIWATAELWFLFSATPFFVTRLIIIP